MNESIVHVRWNSLISKIGMTFFRLDWMAVCAANVIYLVQLTDHFTTAHKIYTQQQQ